VRGRGAAAIALAAGIALATIAPAAAGPGTALVPAAQTPTHLLALVEQTPFVAPDGELDLRLRTTGAPPGAQLRWEVHDRVRSRSEFTRTVDGQGLRQTLLRSTTPLSALPTDAAGTVLVRIPVRSEAGDQTRVRLSTGGVYPVKLDLLDDRGSRVDGFVTHLIRLPDAGDDSPPLMVAVVLPVHAPPALQPDGQIDLADRARQGIQTVVAALQNHASLPLTVLPTPETVDALAASSTDDSLLTSLQATLAGRQVVGGGYVPADDGAFDDHQLTDELSAAVRRGTGVLTDHFGAPDTTTWIGDPTLDDAALDHLRDQGVSRLVVPDTALAPLNGSQFPVTLTQPFSLGADAQRVEAMAADSALSHHAGETGDPVLDAHLTLADIATLYGDNPPQHRVAVLDLPLSWDPQPEYLEALLTGLAPNAEVQPVDLATAFRTVPEASPRGPTSGTAEPATPLVRTLSPTEKSDLPRSAAAIESTRGLLTTYESMIGADSPRAEPLDRRLLVATSGDLSPAERSTYTDSVSSALHKEMAKVKAPSPQTITLTARRGTVPVSIDNLADYAMAVVVRVDSDRLVFPSVPPTGLAVTLNPGANRIEIPVRTRGTGDSPLDVIVMSPDGQQQLDRTRFRIRSTAVSGVGIFLSVGAGAFLLLWWFRSLRRQRRQRAAKRLVHPATTADAAMTGAAPHH
jgi:hypothetical protein